MSRQIQIHKLPTFPVLILAECRVFDRPWVREELSQDVRFRLPRSYWLTERVEGREYLDSVMRVASPEDMHLFLEKYGDPGSHSTVAVSKLVPQQVLAGIKPQNVLMTTYKDREYMDFSQFRELRQELQRAARLPIEKWHKLHWMNINGLRVDLNFEEGHLTGECVIASGVRACAAQLFLEKLSGAEYGWCARPDCNKFFRLESKHFRKYCSQDCAHVVAVRTSRERKQQRPKRRRV